MALMKHQQAMVIRRKNAFLAAYAKCGVLIDAAKIVGVDASLHHYWFNHDPEYAKRFSEVAEESIQVLESEARRRAVEGTAKPVYHCGRKCGEVREYSDTLLIFLLKAARPEVYRERQEIQQTVTHNGPVEIKVIQDENWYGNANLISAEGTPQPNSAAAIACEIQSPSERPTLGENGTGLDGGDAGARTEAGTL
jgi:hypothetical protein